MMRMTKLLDLSHIYSEWSAVSELVEDPNIYNEEAIYDEPPHDPFLPGFAVEIPKPLREEAEEMDLALLDDEARPDGNAWLTRQFPEKVFLRFLLDHGACFIHEAYETDYLETAETIGFEPKGSWTGYKYRNLAFFLREDDAREYEAALSRYQRDFKS